MCEIILKNLLEKKIHNRYKASFGGISQDPSAGYFLLDMLSWPEIFKIYVVNRLKELLVSLYGLPIKD